MPTERTEFLSLFPVALPVLCLLYLPATWKRENADIGKEERERGNEWGQWKNWALKEAGKG
jgi:hypothetical protein